MIWQRFLSWSFGVALLLHSCHGQGAELSSFELVLDPPEQLLMSFTAPVLPSACNSQALTFQDGPAYSSLDTAYSPANNMAASCSSVPPGQDLATVVAVDLHESDWLALQGNIHLCTSANNCFISLTSQFISDAEGVGNAPISSSNALPVESFTPNQSPPQLLDASLDLDSGLLTLSFSEGINLTSVEDSSAVLTVGKNTSLVAIRASNSMSISATDFRVVAIALESNELNSLKLLVSSLLSSNEVLLLSLSLPQATFTDGNGEGNPVENSFSLRPTQDTTAPLLLSYIADLNSGVVSLSFSEPVDVASVSLTQVCLTGELPSSTQEEGGGGFNFSSSTLQSKEMQTSLELLPPDAFWNAIKSDGSICSTQLDCLLKHTPSFLQDVGGNALLPPVSKAIAPSLFLSDSTPPLLVQFRLDLDQGTVELTFSEPIEASTFAVTGITFTSAATGSSSPAVPLTTSGTTLSSSRYDTLVSVTLEAALLNEIKALPSDSVALTVESYTTTDKAGNFVEAISQLAPLSAAMLVPDQTLPVLLHFEAGAPQDKQLTLYFSEYVNTSSWNAALFSLQFITGDSNVTYSAFTGQASSTDALSVLEYAFTDSEISSGSFAEEYSLAYSAGLMVLTASEGLITDLSANLMEERVLEYNSSAPPQQALSSTTLLSFELDLDSGAVALAFSEPVVVLSANTGSVHIQDRPVTPAHVVSLVGEGTTLNPDTTQEVVLVCLDETDLDKLKENQFLATSISNTYIVLSVGFAQDANGNAVVLSSGGFQSTSVTLDTTPPHVLTFDLDLDSGVMSVEFSEPVVASSFDASRVGLSDAASLGTQTATLQLTSAAVLTEGNPKGFQFLLGTQDTLEIKRLPLCTTAANCFASFAPDAVLDTSGVGSAGTPLPIPVDTLLPDVTPPRLVAFPEFDLNTGTFTLSFSEPVSGSSTEYMDIQFVDSPIGPSISVALSGGINTPDNIEIDFYLTVTDLNAIKFWPGLCLDRESCWVRLPSFFITDVGSNPFLHSGTDPDAAASFHQPSVFIPDTTQPVLLYFTVNMDAGRIVLFFDEVLFEPSFLPSDVTLHGSPMGGGLESLTLSLETGYARDNTVGTFLVLNVTAADQIWLKSRPLFSSLNDSYLSLNSSLTDITGNVFQPLDGLLQAGSFLPDATGPRLLTFDLFNIDEGYLQMSFDEPVDEETLSFSMVTILGNQSDSAPVFTLSGGAASLVDEEGLVLRVSLVMEDRIALKLMGPGGLAGGRESTFVLLGNGAVLDTAGNPNQEIEPADSLQLAVGGYTADSSLSFLVEFSLDMNEGLLSLTFDDVINHLSLRPSFLQLQSSEDASVSSHTLSNSSLVLTSEPSVMIELLLSTDDINSLKEDLSLAVSISTSYVSLQSSFAQDFEGREVIGVPPSLALRSAVYTRDFTKPEMESFSLDVDSGVLEMVFSEPVLISSFTFSSVTLLNSEDAALADAQLTLTGGTVSESDVSTALKLSLVLTYSDLNILKSLTTSLVGESQTFIMFTSQLVQDTSDNPILALSPLPVHSLIQDTTRPSLVHFDVDLRSTGYALLQFSEAVLTTADFLSGGVRLQNSPEEPSITLTISPSQDVSSPALDRVEVLLSSEQMTQLLTDPSIASTVDLLFVSVAEEAVEDHAGNRLVPVQPTRVRFLYKSCFSTAGLIYNNITTGTCQDCPGACLGGCSGSSAVLVEEEEEGEGGGCFSCAVVTISNSGELLCSEVGQGCPVDSYTVPNDSPLAANVSGLVEGGELCAACHPNCLTCSGPDKTLCSACRYGYLSSSSNEGNIAICCDEGDLSCTQCHRQCLGCTGPSNQDCVACREDSITDTDGAVSCVPTCSGTNSYLGLDSSEEYNCLLCDVECSGCFGPTSSDCIECLHYNTSTIGDGDTSDIGDGGDGVSVCVGVCPFGSYGTSGGRCAPCRDVCLGCSGPAPTDCIECSQSSIVTGNGTVECVPSCQLGRYYDTGSKSCRLDNMVIIIGGAVGGGVLLAVVAVLFLAICCCLCKRRRNGKSRSSDVYFMGGTSLSTTKF